jgi:hypothetical protein
LDETTTLAIITTLIIVAAGLTGSVIVASLTERLRNSNEKKAAHLRQIKTDVLQPIRFRVTNHYLPILQFRNSNLTATNLISKKIAAKLNEQPVDYALDILVWEPGANPVVVGSDEKSGYEIDSTLLSDCREHHYVTLLKKWDNLLSDVNAYNDSCLRMSQKLTEEIRAKLDLPLAKVWDQAGEYVTPALGFEVFQRMIGLGNIQFSTSEQDMGYGKALQVRLGASKIAQLKAGSSPQQFEKVLDGSIDLHRDEIRRMMDNAQAQAQNFEGFAGDLTKALESQKLPGKCSYV